MSYYSVCAANPAKASCPITCVCQGHYKVYPNQACKCPQPEPDSTVYPVTVDEADAVAEDIETAYVPASLQTPEIRAALVAAFKAGAEYGAKPF